ncbi:MAG: hypothetical protein WCJ55_15350 [Chloroflexales bacterium]
MSNLQRIRSGSVQIWQALPTWGKVTAVIVGVFVAYYCFAFVLGMFFLVAMAVGMFTLIRWLLTR